MQPIHSLEYEVTSQMAAEVHRLLVRWQLRRTWRRDLPLFAGALVFAALIIWLGLEGWILPGVGGALLCLLTFFAVGAFYRRWSLAYGAAGTALLALHTSDRRVRIELGEERVRLETEFFRGEGAWDELEEIVLFPGYWLLQLTNGGQILMPAALVTPDLEAFLRERAREFAAPVRHA